MATMFSRKPRKAMTPESAWRSDALKLLRIRYHGVIWEYRTVGNGMSRSGVPDDILIIRGIPVLIEWKRHDYKPGKHPTAQDREIEAIRKAGGRAAKVKNWEELETLLDGIEPVQYCMLSSKRCVN